jgi:hypothetical protein
MKKSVLLTKISKVRVCRVIRQDKLLLKQRGETTFRNKTSIKVMWSSSINDSKQYYSVLILLTWESILFYFIKHQVKDSIIERINFSIIFIKPTSVIMQTKAKKDKQK